MELQDVANGFMAIVGVRNAEEASYVRLAELGDQMEVRRYRPVMVAEVTGLTQDRAFGLLFRYISGANRSQTKIAMTTPVENRAEKIAMTSPVETENAKGETVMRFFLPAGLTPSKAPVPTDPAVRLVEQPERILAVFRFSGLASGLEAREQKLREALSKSDYKPEGRAMMMFYDPPFTLPPLRRNELAITVRKVQK
jgi:SOUL heme-binding protein